MDPNQALSQRSLSPFRAGLSHMSKEFEEEVFAPLGTAHFAADRAVGRVHPQDVLGQPTDDCKVLGRVVLARARVVLVEYNVEDPVQLVLDAPMGTHNLGQFGWRQLARERDIARRGRGLAIRSVAL